MAFTLNVHQRDKSNPSVFVKIKPYVRLSERGMIPHFIQEGRFYTEDGAHVNQPPKWALEQAEGLSDKVKQSVQYQGPPKQRGRPSKKVDNDGDNQSNGNVD